MDLIPKWSKQVKLAQRARNPLGLTRISQYITSELLPGITTLTNRARNYIFYCWVINQLQNYNIKTLRDFYLNFTRLETAYVIAGLLDVKKNIKDFSNIKGPIGRIKGTNFIKRTPKGNKIKVNKSILEHRGGGYGQYFKNPMDLLDLTTVERRQLILSPTGENLANLYEKNIKTTEYFKNNLQNNEIEKEVLEQYGEIANFLRLRNFQDEGNEFIQVLFNDNLNSSDMLVSNPSMISSRKSTLLLILDLFELFTPYKVDLTDEDFRNIVYYNETLKDHKKISYKPVHNGIIEIIYQWRFFQLQEYLTEALESVLIAFIESLKMIGKRGMKFEEFINTNKNFIKELPQYLGDNYDKQNLLEIFNTILNKNSISEKYGLIALEKFNKNVKIESNFSEFNIFKKMKEIKSLEDIKNNLTWSILLLLIIYLRFRDFQHNHSDKIKWILENNNIDLLSFQTLENDIENAQISESFLNFFKYIVRIVIDQHNNIANIKLKSRNNTFRFQTLLDQSKYNYRRSYYHEPSSAKFHSIKEIFDDLGLIEKEGEIFKITEFGKKYLEVYKNG